MRLERRTVFDVRPTLNTACRVGLLGQMLRLLVKQEAVLTAEGVDGREGLAFLAGHLSAHVGTERVHDVVDPADGDPVSWSVNQLRFLSMTHGVAAATALPR